MLSESSDSDVDYGQEWNWNETDEWVEGIRCGDIIAHGHLLQVTMPVYWTWR